MLEKHFSPIGEARSKTDILSAVETFAHAHGFAYGSVLYVAPSANLRVAESHIERVGQGWLSSSARNNTAFLGVTITNDRYIDEYVGPNATIDPVMRQLKTRTTPLLWNQAFYAQHGELDMHDHMSSFGLRSGLITAWHLPGNEHLVVGFEGPDQISSKPKVVTGVMAELQLWVSMAIEPCRAILVEPHQAMPGSQFGLTSRELEVLSWSVEGKTAHEIAQIIGFSESMATKHLASIISKLGCVNLRAAVVKALRHKVID